MNIPFRLDSRRFPPWVFDVIPKPGADRVKKCEEANQTLKTNIEEAVNESKEKSKMSVS